ncbi:MAG: efflux RND transporter periplasmic adaptor subunit [Deltaproteobacteria bacterium]|nr:MAG: efflux RND transporter periplasmic adaptor subunit [Deltaproteobacteria bacterium]
MSRWLRILQLGAGVVILVVAVLWLSGACGERIAPGERTASPEAASADARTAVVEAVRESAVEWASGTVASAHETAVSSKILARIAEIPVRAGSVVDEGDILVRLERRDLEARVAEAEDDRRAAQARRELAARERERTEQLFASKVASQQQLDRARSELRVAEAGVRAAEERLEQARAVLDYAVIRAPVSGRVVDRLAEPGDTAAPGAPLLRLYDPGALRLEAPVRETLAVGLAPGQALRLEIVALGRTLEGTIAEIVPFAEPGARTLLVKVSLPPGADLYAGMFGRVEIPAGERTRFVVPAAAVRRVGQLEFASVVRADGTLDRRTITTGAPDARGRLEVLSGLVAGERVLLPTDAAEAGGSG